MKKILYFDTWTQGLENYLYIDKVLKEKYTTLLLHVESLVVPYFAPDIDVSWYKAEKEQVISGILCKDVSAYNGMKIVDILKQESPDVVLMLSLSHLQNRIATVACKRLGIKVVFMMHGILGNQSHSRLWVTELAKANRFKFLLKFKKIFKFLNLLKEYQAASDSVSDTLSIAFQLFRSPFMFSWEPKAHHSLDVDKALVYSLSDVSSISGVHKIESSKCVVTGNPKLDIAIEYMDQGRNDSKQKTKLLYFEGFLNSAGILSDAQQRELLSYLKSEADQNSMGFLIRLHPGTNRQRFIEKFGVGCMFTPDGESLHNSLLNAKIVVGQQSTALLETIAYRVPTITLKWHEGSLKHLVVVENDIGLVKEKSLFKAKLKEFNERGWLQEETRDQLFPRGEVRASENILAEIEALIK